MLTPEPSRADPITSLAGPDAEPAAPEWPTTLRWRRRSEAETLSGPPSPDRLALWSSYRSSYQRTRTGKALLRAFGALALSKNGPQTFASVDALKMKFREDGHVANTVVALPLRRGLAGLRVRTSNHNARLLAAIVQSQLRATWQRRRAKDSANQISANQTNATIGPMALPRPICDEPESAFVDELEIPAAHTSTVRAVLPNPPDTRRDLAADLLGELRRAHRGDLVRRANGAPPIPRRGSRGPPG